MERVYIVMGVSGSGKSTIGQLLAHKLALPFYDADAYHPASNIQKMSQGIPLNDTDRKPWLETLTKAIKDWNTGAVLACSALKTSYRNILSQHGNVQFIYLEGDFATIQARMQQRDHFMKPEMLQSQFETLEAPENAIVVSINQNKEQIVSEIHEQITSLMKSQLGIIGMGVMGKSLAKNSLRNGITTAVFNRATHGEALVIPNLLKETANEKLQGFTELTNFVNALIRPRKILLMVPAGPPVDAMITQLSPLLDAEDIIIDGGNSNYKDTQARTALLKENNINFLGIGISGGEAGALSGPSMMAGGDQKAYSKVAPLLEQLAAKDAQGNPCISLLGNDGAGHAVKTLHNGIEYAEMQLLAEVYGLLITNFTQEEVAKILEDWNEGDTQSFLLETTIDILKKKEADAYLLPKIQDVAKAKGTGSWSVSIALDLGVAATCMTAAVQARSISAQKALREALAKKLAKKGLQTTINIAALKESYQMARIINHYQGLWVIQALAQAENWDLNLAEVARIWTEGCILKSQLVKDLQEILKNSPDLFLDDSIINSLNHTEKYLADTLQKGQVLEMPLPCFSAAYQFWLGITTAKSAANMIQAQRDAFGAHSYQRIDAPKEQTFTTNWKQHD